MEIASHEKVFACRKCNVPFDDQYDRIQHEKVCISTLLLPRPEPVIKEKHKTFTQYLEESAAKDPFNYKRYIGRINIYEPNNMIEAYEPNRKKTA